MTGMAAARIMLDAGYGILRTVPPPSVGAVTRSGTSRRHWECPGRTARKPVTCSPP